MKENRTELQQVKAGSVFGTDVICGRHARVAGTVAGMNEGGRRCKGEVKENRDGLPLVSVITVVKNGMPYLSQCLDSVLMQTYENIEYIVIDGNSGDGTLELLQSRDDELDYYVSRPDTGIYNAMNTGLGLAYGDFIIFINSDDWYVTEAVEKLLNRITQRHADVAYADAHIVNGAGVMQYRLDSWFNAGLFTRGASIRHETMLVGKHVYNVLGEYDESYKIISDYEFMMRLYASDYKCVHVREPLLHFRNTGISNTAELQRRKERVMIFRRQFPFLDEDALRVLEKHGRIPNSMRLNLLLRYGLSSRLFAQSMLVNMIHSVASRAMRVFLPAGKKG